MARSLAEKFQVFLWLLHINSPNDKTVCHFLCRFYFFSSSFCFSSVFFHWKPSSNAVPCIRPFTFGSVSFPLWCLSNEDDVYFKKYSENVVASNGWIMCGIAYLLSSIAIMCAFLCELHNKTKQNSTLTRFAITLRSHLFKDHHKIVNHFCFQTVP